MPPYSSLNNAAHAICIIQNKINIIIDDDNNNNDNNNKCIA